MELNIDEGTNPLQSVVQQLIFESNLQVKLEATDVVINALDDNISKSINAIAFQKYLHSLFGDGKFMRQLQYVSQMKSIPELSVEYHGQDYLSLPDFNYDSDFEKRISIIKKKLQNFLGKLLREFSKGTEISL